MDNSEFEKLIEEAIENLPPEFKEKMGNLVVIVEDEPSEETIRKLKLKDKYSLFGLYAGNSLRERGFFDRSFGPNVIIIYQKNHERQFQTPDAIRESVRKTFLHEVGHYLGMSEVELGKYKIGNFSS